MENIRVFRKVTFIVTIIIISAVATTMVMPNEVYGATSTKKKVASYKKSIKSYNTKTQKLAKKTTSAEKWAKKTKSYVAKSKKTKKIRTLKKLKSKAKSAYLKASVLDYQRQIKESYSTIKSTVYQAPSLTTYFDTATLIYNKANKSKSVMDLKSYLNKINKIKDTAKSEKAKLKWYDAEYSKEWIKPHYETVVIQKAEYKYMIVSYYIEYARSKGVVGMGLASLTFDECLKQGKILPYDDNTDKMKEWGCIYYSVDNGKTVTRTMTKDESYAFAKELTLSGGNARSVETGEWFLIKEEITKEQFVDGYYKYTLVRAEGWY